MSDRDTLRLERALAADPSDAVALEALAAANTRAGRGWAGETLPRDLVCSKRERGVYLWTRHGLGLEMVRVPALPPTPVVALFRVLDKATGRPPRVPDVRREGFWVGRYPVTCGEFLAFVRARPHASQPWASVKSPSEDDHPVVNVTHADATAFAAWTGLRLPTAAEWTRAAGVGERVPCHIPGDPNPHDPSHHRACGICDGEGWLPARRYPWGNVPPTPERCVSARWDAADASAYTRSGQNARRTTVPVRDAEDRPARPDGASPCGAMDMVGHVWQWVAPTLSELLGEAPGTALGCSFSRVAPSSAVSVYRAMPERTAADVGFRVALSAPEHAP